uniref:PI3K/PI4K catalytic domain-containing protein n=1 Tax=Plectus sambesii TaxID=2011161 RepID=A0A914VN48_9BILA
MRSVQRPKRMTLLGSDGRRYPMMCKPGDELRKDQRVMEVNRVVNAILRQDPEARRRQLFVRTYSVVPLQAAGGLIEWVPNLQPYRYALSPLVEEKAPPLMTDKEWFGNKPATDAPID